MEIDNLQKMSMEIDSCKYSLAVQSISLWFLQCEVLACDWLNTNIPDIFFSVHAFIRRSVSV